MSGSVAERQAGFKEPSPMRKCQQDRAVGLRRVPGRPSPSASLQEDLDLPTSTFLTV